MFASFIDTNDSCEIENKTNLMCSINFNEPETPASLFTISKNNGVRNEETMKIYLRFRPLSKSQSESPFSLSSSNTIIANPPEQSFTYKNLLHGNGKGYQKFSFSKVFMDQSNQEFVFDETSKTLIEEFICGNDRLLFTYGTTSGGKTFTMNGKKNDMGIIPRSLHLLFKSTKLSNNPSIMPVDFCEVSHLKIADINKLLKDKSILLKNSEKESSDLLNIFANGSFSDEQDVENSEVDVMKRNYETTFWISYTEIYNEFIYDLLDPNSTSNCSIGNNNKLKRPILDIRSARIGGSYVKGLRSYPVYSAEEALRLLLVGRRNQSMGATKLNQNSSRSHTILTIRAVKTMPGSEYFSKVSNLSFCDLAGSERTDKAQTSGISQKEASNINSSLLALGRCIDVLKYNQSNPNNQRVVPYRDSKLTRLFQTYLGGNGKASMIVCINQDPNLFDETLQVLKFSALARKVILHEKEKPEPKINASKERPSLYRRLGMTLPNNSDEDADFGLLEDDLEMNETLQYENDDDEEEEEHYDSAELLDIIERLKAELIATKKEKVANEAKLRETINNEWSKTIMEMERDNTRAIEELRNQMGVAIQKRAKEERKKAFIQLKKRKLQQEYDDGSDDNSSDSDSNGQLHKKIAFLQKEVECLRDQLKEAEEELVDSNDRAENLSLEKDQLQVRCRELEFQISLMQKIKPRVVLETANFSVQVDNKSSETRSSLLIEEAEMRECDSIPRQKQFTHSNKDVFNRFSTVTANPLFKRNDLQSSPVVTSTNSASTATKKNGEHKNLFKIYIDENDEDETDFSFLKQEEECKLEEMEYRNNQLEDTIAEKVVIIKDLNDQLSGLESQLQSTMAKLISREKSLTKLSDKDVKVNRKLDTLLKQVDMASDDNLDINDKLKILSKCLKRIQAGFDKINLVIPSLSQSGILNDATNRMSLDSETNHIVAYIRQLENQFNTVQSDYRQLLTICNEWIIIQAKSHFNIKIKRIRSDTSMDDICARFQQFWNCIINRVPDVTTTLENLSLEYESVTSSKDISIEMEPDLSDNQTCNQRDAEETKVSKKKTSHSKKSR